MTQRLKVAGPSPDYATLSAAIAALPSGVPFIEPYVLEVYATAPTESITIPSTVLPTASNPLVVMVLRQDPIIPIVPDIQSESGSESIYPAPQPRLTMAVMNSFDIQSNWTTVDAFQVNGDAVITADTGVVVNGCRMVGGQVKVWRSTPTTVTVRISNIETRKTGQKSGIYVKNAAGVQIYHNTIVQRREDALDVTIPSYALEIIDGVVDARNNIISAQGVGRSALKFIGSPSGSMFDHNLYASFEGAKRFSFGASDATIVETDDKNAWANYVVNETDGMTEDPEFRERLDPANPDYDISDTSPAMAAAPALPDIKHDIRGERRPYDFVTMGAHDHAEVITQSGQLRFLQLLSGVSTSPVTKCVLGDSGSATLFQDFPAQFADDNDLDELFQPINIHDIQIPAPPGMEGLVVFHPAFQVTLPIYGEIVGDSDFDRADEVGLVATDNTTFMIKRMHSIPFDACGFMHTQFTIPLEIRA